MAQEIDNSLLNRIAEALERLAPRKAAPADLAGHSAFVWHAAPPELEAVPRVNRVDLSLLRGIDLTRDILIENTERFARLVSSMSKGTQFLFISHNKIAMEMAEQLIGVTMQEQGVSRIVAVDMDAAVSMVESS